VSILPLLLLLSAPALPAALPAEPAVDDAVAAERNGMQAAWQECLYDRADALAGYARLAPDRAAELALVGCEEKARVFRQAVGASTSAAGGAKLLAEVEAAMKRYALIVARASAAVPLESAPSSGR
jgi:hypothetical protein